MRKELFILLTFLLLSCSKNNNDETINLSEPTSLKLVTGINCRQTFDDPTLKLGNPNILVNNKFLIYPNPANSAFNILVQENVTDIWIVPANPEKIHQGLNFSNILNSNLYNEQTINSNSNYSLNGQSSSDIGVNIGTLAKGYYKVFVKIDGQIYWDNLYKYENNGTNAEQFTLINSFWN